MPAKIHKLTDGATAAKAGSTAELCISAVLDSWGIPHQRQTLVGTNIYGAPLVADIFVPDMPGVGPVYIESKWQRSSGSADEKFPYLVCNIRERYPAPVIVVCDGGGARPCAVAWLRRQADGVRLMAVLDLSETLRWVQDRIAGRPLSRPAA
jgi:hypothetical protein